MTKVSEKNMTRMKGEYVSSEWGKYDRMSEKNMTRMKGEYFSSEWDKYDRGEETK